MTVILRLLRLRRCSDEGYVHDTAEEEEMDVHEAKPKFLLDGLNLGKICDRFLHTSRWVLYIMGHGFLGHVYCKRQGVQGCRSTGMTSLWRRVLKQVDLPALKLPVKRITEDASSTWRRRFQMQWMYAMIRLPNTCRLAMDDFQAGRQVEQDWDEPCESSWRMSKLEKSNLDSSGSSWT
jgi:hypothetical protein